MTLPDDTWTLPDGLKAAFLECPGPARIELMQFPAG